MRFCGKKKNDFEIFAKNVCQKLHILFLFYANEVKYKLHKIFLKVLALGDTLGL